MTRLHLTIRGSHIVGAARTSRCDFKVIRAGTDRAVYPDMHHAQSYKSKSPLLCLLSLTLLTATAACVDVDATGDDPAGALADVEEEWLDEGPLPEDDVPDEPSEEEDLLSIAARPGFQLPFRCGQLWAGQTRTNHSPTLSVDFNRFNDFGDLVVASAAGKVVRVEHIVGASYGRWIEIAHGNGYRTRYAHLSGYRVVPGQRVKRGQILGRVGNSGGSTGAHLHYEQRRFGTAIRATFNGNTARYFGTRNYRSRNCR